MLWPRSIYVLCTVILIVTTALAEPIPASKKSELAKSNTRHEHNNNAECQYSKGAWSECSPTTNTKVKTLTLKKGQDEIKCEKTKTVEKKCRKSKSCKYDKGTWSKCNASNEMTRTDVLKNASETDVSCEKTKIVTKTCKNKTDRNGKGQQKRNKHNKQQEQVADKTKKQN